LAISHDGDFDETGLRNFGSICEGQVNEIISLLTAEPAPCESCKFYEGCEHTFEHKPMPNLDAREVFRKINGYGCDDEDEGTAIIDAYASLRDQKARADERKRDIAGEVWDMLADHLPATGRTAIYDMIREHFPIPAILQGTERAIVEREVAAKMSDPVAVYANALRGTIDVSEVRADERRRCAEAAVAFVDANYNEFGE
jgi:hypothetical protein